MRTERIDTLQAGRALAALAVVAHHSVTAAHDFGGSYIPALKFGWLGVDFFFVLSGFIIAFSINGKSFQEYAWHRIRRVFLPYLPIGIGIAALYVLFPGISAGNREWNWVTSLTLAPFGRPALSVAWTLQHEMVFYAVFAAAYFTGRLWILAIWGVLCTIPNDFIAFDLINLEFLMGVACFYATRASFKSVWLLVAAIIPLSLWLALGARQGQSVLVGLSIALTLPVIIKLERRGLIINPVFIFLGGASYSIYLAHGFAVSLAVRVFANMGWCFAVGVSGGIAYYFLVERLVLKLVSKRIPVGASEPQET